MSQFKNQLAEKQQEISKLKSIYDLYAIMPHYCLIQYCPCRFRDERLNAGLVLITQDNIRVKLIESYDRLKNAFGLDDDQLSSLSLELYAVEEFIKKMKSIHELEIYASTRANDIRLTLPRLTKEDFSTLCKELLV